MRGDGRGAAAVQLLESGDGEIVLSHDLEAHNRLSLPFRSENIKEADG